MSYAELDYLDLIEETINAGYPKAPVRFNPDGSIVKLSNATIGLPNRHILIDMEEGFPLLTTKFVPLKIVAVELEGFIKGITDKNWYKERKCNIWNEWANPEKVEYLLQQRINNDYTSDFGDPLVLDKLKKEIAKECNVLGPIYGYQWRRFCENYDNNEKLNGVKEGFDQLQDIVNKLHKNPYDRRMYCSAWNPNQMHLMALPPCHLGWGVTVYNDKLHLNWTQRSCDAFLGIPFNIASYALLLTLLAKEANLEPGTLMGNLIDFHVYDNHVEQVNEQLLRQPYCLPNLEITNFTSIFDWQGSDFKLTDYKYHPAIKGEVTV